MTRAAQQKLLYALVGQVSNVFNKKVFMKSGSHPSDIVRFHLGSGDFVLEKSLMDMWISIF